MKLTLCQLRLTEGDCAGNLAAIESAIRAQAADAPDILCFPELAVSGYAFDTVRSRPVDERAALSALARAYHQPIFAGYAVEEQGRFYDAAGFFDETGALLGEYRKIHLYGSERDFFAAGDELALFSFRGWRIGLLICADLGFGEVSRIMAVHGCDLLLTCSAWYAPWHELYQLLTRARAAENQMFVAGVNRANGDLPLCGHSSMVDPSGSVIAAAQHDGECFLTAELDKAALDPARAAVPWVSKMLRPDVYGKEAARWAEKSSHTV